MSCGRRLETGASLTKNTANLYSQNGIIYYLEHLTFTGRNWQDEGTAES